MKAYELLAREGIIYNRRGLGYFVEPTAREKILAVRRKEFLTVRLPEMVRQMRLLGISMDVIMEKIKK